jgi:hypothetical protein
MIVPDPSTGAGLWREELHRRLAGAMGSRAAESWAQEVVAAVADYLVEHVGMAAVRDEEINACLGEALCAVGRPECVPPLVAAAGWGDCWGVVLGPKAPPALRYAALRRWARPTPAGALGPDVWLLDAQRMFRDEPSGLDLVRFRLLAGALDAIAAAVSPDRGFDALAVRGPSTGSRAEILAFCRARLAGAAVRHAWPRVPDVVQAEIGIGKIRRG